MTEQEPKPIRTFVIVHPDGTETGSYRGRSPRQAALKAVKEVKSSIYPITVRIRERGTKTIHVFTGGYFMEKVPEKHPVWMKVDSLIKRSYVKKVGIEKIDRIGPALVNAGVITGEQLKEIEKLPVPEQKEKVN